MLQFQSLSYAVDGSIVTVWLDRPPVNAVDQQMYRSIAALFSAIDSLGADIRVVILAARGRHFCAGNDLSEFETLNPENSPERMREVREAFFAIQDAPIPVIAAVQGVAYGTGLAIAASCDFVVAAHGARFGTPEVSVGVMGGARHLMRLVPQPIARWMYLTAEPVGVERLLGYGSVLDVVSPVDLMPTAQMRARQIARHNGTVLRFAKRSLGEIEHMPLQPAYEFEQSLTGELSGHAEAKEALLAARPMRGAALR